MTPVLTEHQGSEGALRELGNTRIYIRDGLTLPDSRAGVA